MIGSATVIRGNALHLPLPDASVDLICTSPPYFGLRSYQDAGAHYTGQIGSEATPTEFLEALLAATREMVRVLKPSGSLFVNLGDKYCSVTKTSVRKPSEAKVKDGAGGYGTTGWNKTGITAGPETAGVPFKSLMGIPWRYAIACIDQLGLILRAEIIWSKPNGLPESVTDRVRRSHEQWFHFTRQPRYFAAVDEIREPQTYPNDSGRSYTYGRTGRQDVTDLGDRGYFGTGQKDRQLNPLGKLPGSVWQIPSQPLEVPPELGVDHFAAYPMEWPRRIIQGWTPTGICVECGEGRRPVIHREAELRWPSGKSELGVQSPRADAKRLSLGAITSSHSITGYDCGCFEQYLENCLRDACHHARNAHSNPLGKRGCSACDCPEFLNQPPTRPAVVLDPFGGTGTTALVAKALGRHGITIDLSADYCRLAEWRCNDPRQLAVALQIEKPEPVPAGQLSLFEEGTR